MLCKVADLFVEVPPVGDMEERCKHYITQENKKADIVIREADFEPERWPGCSSNAVYYMETCRKFYYALPKLGGIMLHSAAVEYEGRCYLFSGPSTVGKSTHTGLWRELLGEGVRFINDDKPAIRCDHGIWYAYGTPWCGKNGINENRKVPLAGICFLKQSKENKIRVLPPKEAAINVLSQTTMRMDAVNMPYLLSIVDSLVQQVPVYELENKPELAAAQLSYETMRAGSQI